MAKVKIVLDADVLIPDHAGFSVLWICQGKDFSREMFPIYLYSEC